MKIRRKLTSIPAGPNTHLGRTPKTQTIAVSAALTDSKTQIQPKARIRISHSQRKRSTKMFSKAAKAASPEPGGCEASGDGAGS